LLWYDSIGGMAVAVASPEKSLTVVAVPKPDGQYCLAYHFKNHVMMPATTWPTIAEAKAEAQRWVENWLESLGSAGGECPTPICG
jgi:hypothetical protein